MNNTEIVQSKRETQDNSLIAAAQRGDQAAKEQLCQRFAALIIRIAGRFYLGAHALISRQELIQAGYVGFFDALFRYDLKSNASLATYALPWILGEMRKTIRSSMDHAGGYEEIRCIKRAQTALEMRHHQAPTIQEIALSCGFSLWRTAALLQFADMAHLESETSEMQPLSLREQTSIDNRAEFHIALEKLPVQERKLLLLRYYRDLTQAETAKAMGKSQAQISRIERSAIDHMKAQLT